MKKTTSKKPAPAIIKAKTTVQKFEESMTPQEREKYEEEYRDFVLSEFLIALTNENGLSVRKLAKEAGISPRIVQAMRAAKTSPTTHK